MGKIGLIVTVSFFIMTNAAAVEFNHEAASQVSKSIAEWKLANADNAGISDDSAPKPLDTQGWINQGNYYEEPSMSDGILGFDRSFENTIESGMKEWDTAQSLAASTRGTWDLFENSAVNAGIGIGQVYVDHRIALNFPRFSRVWAPVSQAYSWGSTAYDNLDRTGRAIQIMSPPIYLDTKTSFGWIGQGSYPIKNGAVWYQESLNTGSPGSIARTHTDFAKTSFGEYFQRKTTITPIGTSNKFNDKFQRFIVHQWPSKSYWDPQLSRETIFKKSSSALRIDTIRGITKSTPLSNIGGRVIDIPKNWSSQIINYGSAGKSLNVVKNLSSISPSAISSITGTVNNVSRYMMPGAPDIFSYVGKTCGITTPGMGGIAPQGMKVGSSIPGSGMKIGGTGLKMSSGNGIKL